MANAAITADVHQSLDVHRDLGPQRTLHAELLLDHLAKLVHVGVREITDPLRRVDPRLLDDLLRRRPADAVDVRQTDLDLLVAREIDTRNTSHSLSALALLVLGIALADDASHAITLDHLAVLADRLHAAADFHEDTIVQNVGFSGEDS